MILQVLSLDYLHNEMDNVFIKLIFFSFFPNQLPADLEFVFFSRLTDKIDMWHCVSQGIQNDDQKYAYIFKWLPKIYHLS